MLGSLDTILHFVGPYEHKGFFKVEGMAIFG